MAIDTRVIDAIIHGKIEPKIYAFHTGTIPDYLKVGGYLPSCCYALGRMASSRTVPRSCSCRQNMGCTGG